MTVKLKAAILSDLHREFWEVSIPYYSADVVVISGDISSPIQKSMDFLVSYANKLQKPVIAVFGNHDFYNSNIDEALLYAKGRAAESKYLHLLENSSCVIGNTRFIGCTLWSDFSYNTGGNVSNQQENAYLAQANISDFTVIKYGKSNHRFSAMKCISLYQESLQYIESELQRATEGKVVIVTHFGIDKLCSQPVHREDPLQSYFIANVEGLLSKYKIDVWIYGHTHYSNDFKIGKTRVIGNHIGYPTEKEKSGRTRIDCIIEI